MERLQHVVWPAAPPQLVNEAQRRCPRLQFWGAWLLQQARAPPAAAIAANATVTAYLCPPGATLRALPSPTPSPGALPATAPQARTAAAATSSSSAGTAAAAGAWEEGPGAPLPAAGQAGAAAAGTQGAQQQRRRPQEEEPLLDPTLPCDQPWVEGLPARTWRRRRRRRSSADGDAWHMAAPLGPAQQQQQQEEEHQEEEVGVTPFMREARRAAAAVSAARSEPPPPPQRQQHQRQASGLSSMLPSSCVSVQCHTVGCCCSSAETVQGKPHCSRVPHSCLQRARLPSRGLPSGVPPLRDPLSSDGSDGSDEEDREAQRGRRSGGAHTVAAMEAEAAWVPIHVKFRQAYVERAARLRHVAREVERRQAARELRASPALAAVSRWLDEE